MPASVATRDPRRAPMPVLVTGSAVGSRLPARASTTRLACTSSAADAMVTARASPTSARPITPRSAVARKTVVPGCSRASAARGSRGAAPATRCRPAASSRTAACGRIGARGSRSRAAPSRRARASRRWAATSCERPRSRSPPPRRMARARARMRRTRDDDGPRRRSARSGVRRAVRHLRGLRVRPVHRRR